MGKIEELIKKKCGGKVDFFEIQQLFEIGRGRVMSKEYIRDNEGNYPVYSSQTENNGMLGKINNYDLDGEYLTWTTDGANAGTVFYRNGKFSVTNVCGLLKQKDKKINVKYCCYALQIEAKKHVNKAMGNPKLMNNVMAEIKIPVPPLEVQEEIVKILDSFTELTAELNAELNARKKQYEYYRDLILSFDKERYETEISKKVNGGGYENQEIKSLLKWIIEECKNNSNLLKNEIAKKISIWEYTAWDKKFNIVEKTKQQKVIKYYYYLANDLKPLIVDDGNIKILTTSSTNIYTRKDLVEDKYSDGEIVAIPWGGNANIQYYKGKFITADNRIATSLDKKVLSNKYLYYCMCSEKKLIESFYRGSGIKHPDMSKVLDLVISLPPIHVQEKIVSILDRFDKLCNDLTEGLPAEIEARKKQYEYYRDKLLTFG